MPLATSGSNLVATALPRFAGAAGRNWPAPAADILHVHQALARGDLGRARELSEAALSASPESDEAAFTRGVVLYLSAAFGTARPLFEQVLEKGPSFAGCERVFYFYGVSLVRLGEGARAREALLAQLELIPGDGETYTALGELTLQEGDAEGAVTLFRQALEALEAEQQKGIPNGPSRAKVHAGFGNAFLQQGKLQEALQALKASLALDPNQPQPWYALSRVHLRLGDASSARQAVDRFGRLSAGR